MLMLVMWVLLPVIVAILIEVYMYKKAKRAVEFFGKNLPKNKVIIYAFLITLIFTLPIIKLTGTWFIALAHFVVLLLVIDLLAVIIKKLRHQKEFPKGVEAVYRSTIIAIVLTAVILTYGYYNIYNVTRTEYTVTTNKEIKDNGYRIVLISDLHYGITMDREQLEKVAERINNESPDILILAGDIVDERTTYNEMTDAFDVLGKIKAGYGVFYTYGNHDKNAYTTKPNYTKEQLADVINKSGITILEDSVKQIDGELTIIGRADKSDKTIARKDISSLMEDADKNGEVIVVDHQPADYDNVKKAGADMIVSGHTHAGQIWPLGLFASLFHFDEMSYGYRMQGNLNELVTSGIAGWGYPIRTEKHSEYVVINLKKNNK